MQFRTGIVIIIMTIMLISPSLAADNNDQESNPWYWYNKAVDLATAGQYSDALAANEKALAINSSMPLAWANEAGILVQLGRYDDAITAADKVLSTNVTDMPNAYAAAYYSKGDALRFLGRTNEAAESYAQAYKLDSTLVPPLLASSTIPPATSSTPKATLTPAVTPTATLPVKALPTATKTPVSLSIIFGSLLAALVCLHHHRYN